MVSSLNIKLTGEQIRAVIRAIDLDGGGYIDFPEFEAAVKRHEDVSARGHFFCERRRQRLEDVIFAAAFRSKTSTHVAACSLFQQPPPPPPCIPNTEQFGRQVCGEAGSGWKMYVSPVHAIMILHNVETNEELWDYKTTDKDLVRVVKDSIVGQEGIAAKKRAGKAREQEWETLLKDR